MPSTKQVTQTQNSYLLNTDSLRRGGDNFVLTPVKEDDAAEVTTQLFPGG